MDKNSIQKHGYIKIHGVSDKTKAEVSNIAKYLGMTASAFLKAEIRKIIDNYPDKYKVPEKD